MKTKLVILISLLAATLLSVAFIDQALALYINESTQHYSGFFTSFLSGLEFVTGFNYSKYLLFFVALWAGLIFIIENRKSSVGYILLFIATAHFLSRIASGTLKNVFKRPRPYQFVEDNTLADFFTTGSSFPSGHVAHFFSLFLPLVILFPKKTWWLLIIPGLVLIQRIMVNDHYLGDTIASLLIVYIITILVPGLYQRFTVTSKLPRTRL